MDKITRQVRIEHWTQIMNECLNSGMNKTEWCRANGISDKQFFYWQRILRKEAFAASTSKELLVITDPADETSLRKISFAEISLPIKQEPVRNGFQPDIIIRKGSHSGVRYQCGKLSVNLREKAVLEEKLILKRNRKRRSREEK